MILSGSQRPGKETGGTGDQWENRDLDHSTLEFSYTSLKKKYWSHQETCCHESFREKSCLKLMWKTRKELSYYRKKKESKKERYIYTSIHLPTLLITLLKG